MVFAAPAEQAATPAQATTTPATPTPAATTPAAPAQANVPLLPGDAQRGLAKSQTCVACHGNDGNSVIPDYPKIAGQHAGYIVESLHEYREGPGGERDNPIMYGMVANLSDQDILDLAAYYSEQKITLGEADPALVTLGERIYRGGNVEANVPACIACHGPRGEGNAAANFPALSGQNAGYIAAQLHAFRNGTRKGGVNDMMAHVVERMSEEEIKAVASYVSGLH
jgi:cytochrome c553